MGESIIWVGLDVHKDSTTAAIYEGDSADAEVVRLSADLMQIRRLFRRLSELGQVRACYEASGSGYVLQRLLTDDGFFCEVVAPSLIPRRAIVATRTLRSKKHRAWLNSLRDSLSGGPMATVIRTELEQLEYLESKLRSLDLEIEHYSRRPPYRETVEALCCLRGVKVLSAMVLATEIGDIRRFSSPRAFMAWVGLIPQERSSGNREHKGPITKTGNAHIRRILVEAAWNHRHRAGSSLILRRRRQGQPVDIVAIAVKAQHRLMKKYHRLSFRKHQNKVVVAVARELCGFVWAIMKAAPQPC